MRGSEDVIGHDAFFVNPDRKCVLVRRPFLDPSPLTIGARQAPTVPGRVPFHQPRQYGNASFLNEYLGQVENTLLLRYRHRPVEESDASPHGTVGRDARQVVREVVNLPGRRELEEIATHVSRSHPVTAGELLYEVLVETCARPWFDGGDEALALHARYVGGVPVPPVTGECIAWGGL